MLSTKPSKHHGMCDPCQLLRLREGVLVEQAKGKKISSLFGFKGDTFDRDWNDIALCSDSFF